MYTYLCVEREQFGAGFEANNLSEIKRPRGRSRALLRRRAGFCRIPENRFVRKNADLSLHRRIYN